jgi:hypothetical protein
VRQLRRQARSPSRSSADAAWLHLRSDGRCLSRGGYVLCRLASAVCDSRRGKVGAAQRMQAQDRLTSVTIMPWAALAGDHPAAHGSSPSAVAALCMPAASMHSFVSNSTIYARFLRSTSEDMMPYPGSRRACRLRGPRGRKDSGSVASAFPHFRIDQVLRSSPRECGYDLLGGLLGGAYQRLLA